MQLNKSCCPINHLPVNQTKVRLVAFFVFLLASLYCLTPHWGISGILLADFFCRAFQMGRYSVLGNLSELLISLFSLPEKTVDAAAKEFAALLGFIVCDVLFIVSSLLIYDVGIYIAGLLLCLSFLEAAFGVCLGCYAYPYFQKLKFKGTNNDQTLV